MATIAVTANTSWYLFNFRKNTILSLIQNGHNVFVIAPFDTYSDRLESLGIKFIHIKIDQGGTNPIADLKTFLSFYRIFANNEFDVVLNFTPKNNIYSSFAAALHKVKVINNIAGLGTIFINDGFVSKIVRLLYKYSHKYVQKVFFQNNEDMKLFIDNNFIPSFKAERIPGSGVDLSRFSVVQSPNDGVTRFLLIARMLYDKGIQQYIDAARELRLRYDSNVEFYLLGFLDVNNPSAVSSQQMQEWVNEGVVIYLGVSDSVEKEISRMDCVVLPSYYREGVPKSLLEAGAMGKPLITTDNVGCRETVDHGINGFLCEPKSTSSLVNMLNKVICMTHEQRLTMGLQSRSKMERYFDEMIGINKYLSTINYLISDAT